MRDDNILYRWLPPVATILRRQLYVEKDPDLFTVQSWSQRLSKGVQLSASAECRMFLFVSMRVQKPRVHRDCSSFG